MLYSLLGINEVKSLYLELTSQCQFRCLHCFQGENLNIFNEFTYDECVNILKTFKENYKTQDLVLLGGEPFTHPELIRIVRKANSLGYNVDICTNAYANHSIIEEIKCSIRTLRISLDGMKKSHNMIRKSGSFDRIEIALNICKNLGINSALTITINTLNYLELNNIVEFGINYDVSYFKFHEIHPSGFAKNNLDLLLEPYQKCLVRDQLLSLEEKYGNILIIDSDLMPGADKKMHVLKDGVADRIEIQPNGRTYLSCKALGDNNNSLWFNKKTFEFSTNQDLSNELRAGIKQVNYLGV